MQQDIHSIQQGIAIFMNLGAKPVPDSNPSNSRDFKSSFESEAQALRESSRAVPERSTARNKKEFRPRETEFQQQRENPTNEPPMAVVETQLPAKEPVSAEPGIVVTPMDTTGGSNVGESVTGPLLNPESVGVLIAETSATQGMPGESVLAPSLALSPEPGIPAPATPEVLLPESIPVVLVPVSPLSKVAGAVSPLPETPDSPFVLPSPMSGRPTAQAESAGLSQIINASDAELAFTVEEFQKAEIKAPETSLLSRSATSTDWSAKFFTGALIGGIQQEQRLRENLATGLDLKSLSIGRAAGAESTQVAMASTAQQASTAQANVNRTALTVPFHQPNWGQGVGEKVLWLVSQKLNFAEIQLDPPELGPLQVKVSVQNDQVSVSFTSQHAPVREALDNQVLRLREILESQGFNLVDVDVSDQSQSDTDQDGEGSAEFTNSGDPAGEELQAQSLTMSSHLVDDFV